MRTVINATLQEHVETIQHAVEPRSTWFDLHLVFIAVIIFAIVSFIIANIKASPAQRWLLMTVSWTVLGAATVFGFHHKVDTQVGTYFDTRAQQEAFVETMREHVKTQYDVMDVTPVLQQTTATGGEYTTEVSRITDEETIEPWLHRLAQHEPFHPALVSVILPETHENAIYMLEFSDNGETLVLKTLPDSDDAPPVEDIVR